jgi:hypothetical protein
VNQTNRKAHRSGKDPLPLQRCTTASEWEPPKHREPANAAANQVASHLDFAFCVFSSFPPPGRGRRSWLHCTCSTPPRYAGTQLAQLIMTLPVHELGMGVVRWPMSGRGPAFGVVHYVFEQKSNHVVLHVKKKIPSALGPNMACRRKGNSISGNRSAEGGGEKQSRFRRGNKVNPPPTATDCLTTLTIWASAKAMDASGDGAWLSTLGEYPRSQTRVQRELKHRGCDGTP